MKIVGLLEGKDSNIYNEMFDHINPAIINTNFQDINELLANQLIRNFLIYLEQFNLNIALIIFLLTFYFH